MRTLTISSRAPWAVLADKTAHAKKPIHKKILAMPIFQQAVTWGLSQTKKLDNDPTLRVTVVQPGVGRYNVHS